MSRPAFLVEGDMEKDFLSHICGKAYPIRKIRCGGDKASMARVAAHISVLLEILDNHNPIVIVFDREGRAASSDDLARDLLEELRDLGADTSKLRIGIPDRMIENWILADHGLMTREFGDKFKPGIYDGKGGKSEIKKMMNPRPYRECLDGVRMLAGVRIGAAAANSPSLKSFLDALDIGNCWWLNKP